MANAPSILAIMSMPPRSPASMRFPGMAAKAAAARTNGRSPRRDNRRRACGPGHATRYHDASIQRTGRRSDMGGTRRTICAFGIAAIAVSFAQSARADAVADFYKGKQINVVVGYGPGGGYDVYTRHLLR